MAQKPSIPKGTRDFSPIEMAKRNYIFNTIKDVFGLYGFQQIETPAMENLSTLMGKYGEEGDKLLFKILNSGDYLKDAPAELMEQRDSLHLTNKISEKGLRYDLTVPFARFVVQHRNDLSMPFKRYQVQPVWRADRPQRGRYREFYQCDADIVGSDSLFNEIELVSMIDEVFKRFGVNIAIKLNNRKILSGVAEIIGAPDKIVDITVAIDKMDKIGIDNVNAELREKGLGDDAVAALQPLLTLTGTNEEKMEVLRQLLSSSEEGMKGIEEMQFVLDGVAALGLKSIVELDVSLARGLNYYTGTILEVKALDVEMGSITGGGRYDNLTGVFGMPGLSGVGISFGADRIFDVLNTLDLYPADTTASARVLFINFGNREAVESLKRIKELRASGISAELYPDAAKMKKQMAYANDRKVPFVAIIGENEIANNTVTLKDMATGEQQSLTTAQLIEALR
ncbi:MAG: histidine--tRNA ligase [Bacteroidales bacterium]|nr:histidine--tRNA ligase [Candidatus Sodaliphilus aphodohippi]